MIWNKCTNCFFFSVFNFLFSSVRFSFVVLSCYVFKSFDYNPITLIRVMCSSAWLIKMKCEKTSKDPVTLISSNTMSTNSTNINKTTNSNQTNWTIHTITQINPTTIQSNEKISIKIEQLINNTLQIARTKFDMSGVNQEGTVWRSVGGSKKEDKECGSFSIWVANLVVHFFNSTLTNHRGNVQLLIILKSGAANPMKRPAFPTVFF